MAQTRAKMTVTLSLDPTRTVTHEIMLHRVMDNFFPAEAGSNGWKQENKKDPDNSDLVPVSI